MYQNYTRIGNKGLSYAWLIINIFLSVVLFWIAVSSDKQFKLGFIILGISFVLEALSALFTIFKCHKFGSKKAFKLDIDNLSPEDKKTLNIYNLMMTIFTVLSLLLFGFGLYLLVFK